MRKTPRRLQQQMPRSSRLAAYLPLLWRLALVACVATSELWLRHLVGRDAPAGQHALFPFQRQVFTFVMAWAVTMLILLVVGRAERSRPVIARLAGTPPQIGWAAVHAVLIVPVIWPGIFELAAPGAVDAWAWALQYPLGLLAALALLCTLVPPRIWADLLRGSLPQAALAAAISLLAVLAIRGMQSFWERTAAVTFDLVVLMLRPFYPDLNADPVTRILSAGELQIFIDKACSGLEGIGLVLVFSVIWLWYLRRDFRFPAALLLVPAGVLLVYLLNGVRIAVLFAIAAGGHPQVAVAGFHSQAGWIFFNATVFLLAIASRNIAWLQAGPAATAPPAEEAQLRKPDANATTAFLLPMLALLATGMLTRAMSTGFDRLYWMRLPIALGVLLLFRRSYAALDWRFSWRGVAAGIVVFAAWLLAAHWLSAPASMPAALAGLSSPERMWWIATRAIVGVLIVPVAEELAFRGFLMRRMENAEFTTVSFTDVRPLALLVSSVLFGLSHGSYWLPGVFAGLLFAAVAVRTGRFGEAVVAHAIANALLAVNVLLFDSWQLW
jgi:exosortase E/protease (VPEID-CTERM system)